MKPDLTAKMRLPSQVKPHTCTAKPITAHTQDVPTPSSPHDNRFPRALPSGMPHRQIGVKAPGRGLPYMGLYVP